VIAVAISNAVAASDVSPQSAYTIEGVSAENWKLKFAAFTSVYGDYFGAMGIPLVIGRTFTMHDDSNAPLVVIVNQAMAKDCWPGQTPLGKRMHVGNPKKGLPWATVVGVVADTKMPRDVPSIDQWYTPMSQPATLYGSGTPGNLSGPPAGYISMRSALDPEHMIQALRSTIAEIDPLLALQEVRPLTDAISQIEKPRRFTTDLITAFAAGALLLAITGIYAVMAFSVSQRTQGDRHSHGLGRSTRGYREAGTYCWRQARASRMQPRCAWLAGRITPGRFVPFRSQGNRSARASGSYPDNDVDGASRLSAPRDARGFCRPHRRSSLNLVISGARRRSW
jgi:putative ABC transport system permease protein